MVNAWSLLYDEINGTMDETYPIKKKNMKDKDDVIIETSDTITFNVPEGAVGAADTINIGSPIFGSASPDTIDFSGVSSGSDSIDFGGDHLPGGMGEDHISFNINPGLANTAYDDPKYYASAVDFQVENMVGAAETINIDTSGFDLYGKDVVTFGGEDKPKPDLKNASNQKYQEDKGIADLKSYVASTYKGHYTNENSDVQTLDLIHSVGDAESFCRSNALKYLSRYDKKGSAKNDILKAMHYCLLLYYFSGNTQEPDYTNTRYETF